MDRPKKILGCREHPDWLKIDLNEAEIISAQNSNRKKN